MTSLVSLKTSLYNWLNSSSGPLLDLRPLHIHFGCRIIPSTCIPLYDLKNHQFELPPKSSPLAVLEPYNNEGVAQKLLKDQGWNVRWVFTESERLWQIGRELRIIEEIDINTNDNIMNLPDLYSKRQRWTLFQPCPFLKNNLNFIEESLRNMHQPNTTFNCLDLACGSGRDVSWLCLRRSVDWHATAIDAMTSALDRTRLLAQGVGVLSKVQTVNVKIMSDGSVKQPPIRGGDTKNGKTNLYDNVDFLNQTYDLVLCVRFLCRKFFDTMAKMVKPGGFLLISTFVNDGVHSYKHPKGDAHRLKLGELDEFFQEQFEVLQNKIELIEDGRPVNSFLARKRTGLPEKQHVNNK
ncbi:1584_t:CDS:1 [Gigaspora margarita]|uniref:1584_t:CDS:1 n=1 Tax=Gigaspora margarita TaxID=4874 RepID=A0ABN7UXG3_GIGMA|nr:1584_t:CDS:1 [Gigaspora margarita]